jgi:Ca2+-binding EF-hand superfamily protein
MQVSGLSGSSAAAALRELFQKPQSNKQEVPSAGQQMPSGASCAMQGMGGVQMSSAIMSSLMGMQTEAPGASNMAAHMLSDLDADGDGVLSLEEATANANSANASEAFATLDADGDGSLTLDELTSALEEAGPPPGGPPPGGPHGPPASSNDLASSLISSLDSDEDDSLSLSEVTKALGAEEGEETSSAFSSLDTDGDGKLSLAELTAALDKYLQAGVSQLAEQTAAQVSA